MTAKELALAILALPSEQQELPVAYPTDPFGDPEEIDGCEVNEERVHDSRVYSRREPRMRRCLMLR